MGKILQIRVQASTYDEKEVRKAWPRLFDLAFTPESRSPQGKKGVMELVKRLDDLRRFADDLDDRTKKILDWKLPDVVKYKNELETALADWKPAAANAASDRLEEELDKIEAEMPREW